MNITRENIDALNGIIKLEIQKTDYEANVAEALKEYRKKASMPGFRPGKIPQGLIVKMYGKAILVEEVNKLISNNLSKYLQDEKLNILGEPLPNTEQQKTIDWDKDADFEFVFDIALAPEIKIAFDKKTKFPYYLISVSEEMIDQEVKSYTTRFGSSQPSEFVDAESTIRGRLTQLDENSNEKNGGIVVESALLAVNIIGDQDSKQLFINKKAGEEVVFDLKKTYPNDTEIAYLLNIDKEEVANVEGEFKLTISEINTFVPASIDMDLFKNVYGEETNITDEPSFREIIANQIKIGFSSSSDYRFSLDAREIILEKFKPELPEAFLKRWLLEVNKELSVQQVEDEFQYFIDDLRWQLIRDSLVKDFEVKVLEDEVLAFAREVAVAQFRQYGMYQVPEEHLDNFAKRMLEKAEDRNRMFSRVQEQKVFNILKSKVTIDEKVVSKEDFEKLFEKQ